VQFTTVLVCVLMKDLKSERCRTQMAAARAVLEKSTMMLLTTTKVSVLQFSMLDVLMCTVPVCTV